MPVKVGAVILVILSVLDVPLSDVAIRSGALGAAGGVLSNVPPEWRAGPGFRPGPRPGPRSSKWWHGWWRRLRSRSVPLTVGTIQLAPPSMLTRRLSSLANAADNLPVTVPARVAVVCNEVGSGAVVRHRGDSCCLRRRDQVEDIGLVSAGAGRDPAAFVAFAISVLLPVSMTPTSEKLSLPVAVAVSHVVPPSSDTCTKSPTARVPLNLPDMVCAATLVIKSVVLAPLSARRPRW